MTKEIEQLTNEARKNNLSAQIASREAIEVGRETMLSINRQGESLAYSDKLADQQSYILDISERYLRGMTWSGWFANMLTNEPTLQNNSEYNEEIKCQDLDKNDSSLWDIPTFDQELSPPAKTALQDVQNYHVNILLLQQCFSSSSTQQPQQTQKIELCIDICSRHQSSSHKSLLRLKEQLRSLVSEESTIYHSLLKAKRKLDSIFSKLKANFEKSTTTPILTKAAADDGNNQALYTLETLQNQHLDHISNDLQELESLGKAMGEAFMKQNHLLHSLDEKNELNLEKTKQVNRRADRIIRGSQLISRSPTLHAKMTIQLSATNEYLTVAADKSDSIYLSKENVGIASHFNLFKIQGDFVFGIQSCLTNKYLSKSIWGNYIYCSSTTMSYRDEFEIDLNHLTNTKFMCCSANYGSGGYIIVDTKKRLLADERDSLSNLSWRFSIV